MLEDLKKTAAGMAVLKEWLGDGLQSVDAKLANSRAKTCSCCPENIHGNWWAGAAGVVAEAIRLHLHFKDSADVWVEDEDKLGTCDVCLCHLPLKVWCPIEHIKNHTTESQLEHFPDFCWIKKEINE